MAWSALRTCGRVAAASCGPTGAPGTRRDRRCTTRREQLAELEADGSSHGCWSTAPPGIESGSAYEIPSQGATLGRGDVEIRLDDPFASSHHARISREGHVVVIEDLGSTNGTYLNEEPLSGPQPLHAGDRIRIGDCEFAYQQ